MEETRPKHFRGDPKIRTKKEIGDSLKGYVRIPEQLWDLVPPGAHVRYFRIRQHAGVKGDPADSYECRFNIGGFVKEHFVNSEGKRFLTLENIRGGSTADITYSQNVVPYEQMDTLWKRYHEAAFIELHMMTNSLRSQAKKIEGLVAIVEASRNEILKLKSEIRALASQRETTARAHK